MSGLNQRTTLTSTTPTAHHVQLRGLMCSLSYTIMDKLDLLLTTFNEPDMLDHDCGGIVCE